MKARRFIFGPCRADWKAGKLEFDYSFDTGLKFTEQIQIPPIPPLSRGETVDKILRNVSLVLGISYYKLYAPEEVEVPFTLTDKQIEFWNAIYRKGLGEFWYRNKLMPKNPFKTSSGLRPTSPSKGEVPLLVKERSSRSGGAGEVLLGVGGGKDSIVAGELMKKELGAENVTAFVVETQKSSPVVNDVIEIMGIDALKIRRTLDPELFEEHKSAYNGHIPISAIYAWLGLLAAELYGFRWVVVGNEHSSNFGNLEYQGETVNHQWSKSQEFEGLFQEYVREFVTRDVEYFSLLRPFTELRITREFAKSLMEKYGTAFTSCNRNFSHHSKRHGRPEGLWCGECPKCAFMFAMLSAFLPQKQVVEIFGKDLLYDPKLAQTFADLRGEGVMKPFDCVGTFEEVNAALDGNIPEHLLRARRAETVPHRFRFVGMKNAWLAGYGVEGKESEKFIKKYYPKIEVTAGDDTFNQNEFDISVRSPGVHKSKMFGQYTTGTNQFFARVPNKLVGITGSKGKSTVASLVYEMLKADGRDAELLGNIGKPMLEALLGKIPAGRIFVLELSSYQLDDIAFSPNVAVITNLFPEHMDYHGSKEAYFEAKRNICRWQRPGDICLEGPFEAEIPVPDNEIPLLGEHNRSNIRAAITAARHFEVSNAAIANALKNFKGLPHRLELVGIFQGIKFYDDAISTAPESTMAAISALTEQSRISGYGTIGTIFLGGSDRGYDFAQLARAVKEAGIPNVVLFPKSGQRIKPLLGDVNILETGSMEEAVLFAYAHTKPGEIALLSTAGPSYSVWTNFEEQGNEFQRWVKTFG